MASEKNSEEDVGIILSSAISYNAFSERMKTLPEVDHKDLGATDVLYEGQISNVYGKLLEENVSALKDNALFNMFKLENKKGPQMLGEELVKHFNQSNIKIESVEDLKILNDSVLDVLGYDSQLTNELSDELDVIKEKVNAAIEKKGEKIPVSR